MAHGELHVVGDDALVEAFKVNGERERFNEVLVPQVVTSSEEGE